ncbi:adenylosuccinate lyase [Hesseltinella vesiculosa]|uniref:Adenylosuccinate lyase n=1 Tax=Hesseltinella vesiculosa TaxID=101127 RepID=A0A1X2G968_9FUNG|nr:adenylosuccinate lyase [Hesseltinella vesiculosa]
MSSVVDSHIFKDIFGTKAMREIWSDETRTTFYLEWEKALAEVQATLGIIPHEAYQEIASKAHIANIDFDKLKKSTELIGYPILGVVQQVVGMCDRGLGEYVHFGATTQDVTDTVTMMQIDQALGIIESELCAISQAVRSLALKYRLTPMVARSNLQQAVPISFGFKMAGFNATLMRHQARVKELRSRAIVLEFGGAAGTLATLGNQGLDCQRLLAEKLGLQQPEIAWHTERDRIAEVGSLLALICGTLSKNATDIKLMMQTEVGEVAEPFVPHRGSSSTMPNKFNPISCAYIHSMAATVRQHAASLMEAMVADHERSTGPWEIEWIVLPEAFLLTAGALHQTRLLMEGLQVFPDKMAKNLALTKGLVVAEAVMIGLGPLLGGRQAAHDIVYDLCRKSAEKDCPLLETLMQDEGVVHALEKHAKSHDWMARLCDPANYLGQSGEMVDRVCASPSMP